MILRQSTAVDVLIGPFVDLTNGYGAESGETPAVYVSKNGQALAAKNDPTVPVHDADGYYNCELDATDTNTVGTLRITVAATATAREVSHEFQVIEENVYDKMFASGAAANLGSDITALVTNLGTVSDLGSGAGVGENLLDLAGATFNTATDSNEATRNALDTVDTNVDTLLTRITSTLFSGITSLANWLRAAIRSDAADATALSEINSGGGDYNEAVAALEALYGDTDGLAAIATTLTSVQGNVNLILSDTGTDGVAISTAVAQAIADEVLKRSVSNVEGTASNHSLAELILANFEFTLSGGVWTIKKTDGATTFNTRSVTTNAAADPITEVT